MDDKIEDTIKAIAIRHGIAVSRDDPILVLQTMNDRLMQDSRAAQERILEGFKSEIEAIAHRWSEDAKDKAEKTLNAALSASKEAMRQGMKQGTHASIETLRREFEGNATMLSGAIREARRVSILNMVAASLAVLAALIALWSAMSPNF